MTYPIKIEFREYPSGGWEDWSSLLVDPPSINKKVESENEGEAGVITFDNASCTFQYESGNAVHNAFSIDLSAKQRYLFKISAPKSDNSYVLLFEGLADFSSIGWNDDETEITFNIVDKLSALGILPADALRSVEEAVYTRLGFTTDEKLEIFADSVNPGWYYIHAYNIGNDSMPAGAFSRGEVIAYHDASGNKQFLLINTYTIVLTGGFYYLGYVKGIPSGTIPSNENSNCFIQNDDSVYSNTIYGVDTYIYDGGPGYIEAFDAIKIIKALYEQVWGATTVVNRTGVSTYPITLEYFPRLIDENPLGSDPLSALKTLADSMTPSGYNVSGCYIYVDKSSQLVIQAKALLSTTGTTRTIGTTYVSKKPKKYFWDKLADGVTVKVKSWITDVNGNYIEGSSTQTKQIPGSSAFIKPKNELRKELLTDDPNDITEELLNTKAATLASQSLNFYGKRRASFNYLLDLDDNTIDWELLDNITIDSVTYFFVKVEFDLAERTVRIPLVETSGHDYDLRQVVIGLSENSSSQLGSSYPSSVGSPGGGAITYVFDYPFSLTGNIVELNITNNLKLTGNQLDTIQPIKTTSDLQFASIGVGAAPDPSYRAIFNGDIKVLGDIQYTGEINQANYNHMIVEDQSIYLNNGGNTASAIGGGLFMLGDASAVITGFTWDGTKWNLDANLDLPGITIGTLAGVLKASTGVVSGGATTSDLPEGSNLYYTDARWQTAWGLKTTTNLPEAINLYYTDARARASISETVTGLTYTSATGVLSLTSGYVIPTTTEESNWNDAYSKRVDTWNAPITFASNVVSLTQTGDVLGTANRLSVSGGTNVIVGATDVTLDISNSYVGQASITTLGTITTGVWNAGGITTSGNVTITTGNLNVGGYVNSNLIPSLVDTYDLGSSIKLWRKGWLSELDTILLAENTQTLLGGWFTVGKGAGTVVGDVSSGDTIIDFGQAMTVGDIVLFRGALKVEYVKIVEVVFNTEQIITSAAENLITSGGDYIHYTTTATTSYVVTRDLDGTGANDWAAGTPYSILGQSGDGRIELNAYDTPRISMIIQGATYNAQSEYIRIGDLNGMPGYSSEIWGMYLGNVTDYLKWDAVNGLNVSGTITASVFNGGEINASTLNAVTINGGNINGITMTGGLFRTSETGNRIEITSGGLKSFSNSKFGTGSAIILTDLNETQEYFKMGLGFDIGAVTSVQFSAYYPIAIDNQIYVTGVVSTGIVYGSNISYLVSTDTSEYSESSTSYVTVSTHTYRHKGGNSYLRLSAQMKKSGAGLSYLKATVNGLSVELSTTSSTYTDESGQLYVASLTDGAIYIITIEQKTDVTTVAYAKNIITEIESTS